MIEGCLFNWTNIYDRRFPVDDGIEVPFLIFAVSAETPFPIADNTFSRTEKTLNSLSISFLIEHCLPHSTLTVLHVLSILQINAIENRDSDH
jgi:hypothetical protein